MTESTDRIYVLDHAHPTLHRHVCGTAEGARTMHEQVPGTLRVFTEEQPWITDHAPDHKRTVIVLFHGRQIMAFFGSEGKWCAEDHTYRVTYLDNAQVQGWCEQPSHPDKLQLGLVSVTGWR